MTPINLYDLWLTLISICNVQQGGQIRPVQDFQKWVNAISVELFHEKTAKFQINQAIADELSPFHLCVNKVVTPQPGQPWDLLVLPTDYQRLAGLRCLIQKEEQTCGYQPGLPFIDCDGKCTDYQDPDYAAMVQKYVGQNLIEATINIVETNRWGACLKNILNGPSWDAPKATQYQGGYKIAPKGISLVIVDYFKMPREAVFGYTISNDTVIYDSTTSTQLEWPISVKNEFLTRLAKKYGVAVREEFVYQAANNDKKELI